MKILILAIIGLTPFVVCLSANANNELEATNTYLTERDRVHLKRVLESGSTINDVSTIYYHVLGYKLLGEPIARPEIICDNLANTTDARDITVERASYAAITWRTLGNCKNSLSPSVSKVLSAVLEKDSPSMAELYYASSGLTALLGKLPRDMVNKLSKLMIVPLKKDDNLWNLSYIFHIAADLGTAGASVFARVEDVLIQADEVDGRYLQFEGGLSLTSFLITGMMKLSATLDMRPSITSQQMVKMSNYLLSRRTVQTPKGATNLLSALNAVANNGFGKPVCITLPEGSISISKEHPFLTVKVCDILGNPLPGGLTVIANSASRLNDDAIIAIRETLLASSTDKTLFTMNLMNLKPDRGFYKVSITAAGITSTVLVKVSSEATIDYLEIGTGDADQTTQPKLQRVPYPESLTRRVEADSQQKLVVRFLLRDTLGKKPLRAHQAFIRLSHTTESNNGYEIIFVAEPDTSHIYKFDMPVGMAAANFGYQSGDYNVELIVGDATITNPLQWVVATVSLKFPEMTASGSVDKNTSPRQRTQVYMPKLEINHVFREPEKRPPAMVSNLFTGLCLAPILLLVVLWAKLGVNISNFPVSFSAIFFHLGLGSIFVLFGIFWLRLNIFVTLRYLLGLGVVTFLAGNKMLSLIAQRHKSLR